MIIQVPDGFGASDLVVTGAWVHYQSGSTGFSLGPEGCHAAQAPLALHWVMLLMLTHWSLTRGDVQMLNLSADWLSIFLPHVLQKINRFSAAHRIHFQDIWQTFHRFWADLIQSSLNSHGFLQFLLLTQRCDLWRHDGSPGGAGFDPAAGHANDPRQAVHSLHWKGCAVAVLRVCSSGHWPLKFVEVLHASNFCGNPFGLKLKIWRENWDPPLFDDADSWQSFSMFQRRISPLASHCWACVMKGCACRTSRPSTVGMLQGSPVVPHGELVKLTRFVGDQVSQHILSIVFAGLPRFLILVSLQRPLDNFLKASSFGS